MLTEKNEKLIESYIKKVDEAEDLVKDIMFLKYFYDDWKTNVSLNDHRI